MVIPSWDLKLGSNLVGRVKDTKVASALLCAVIAQNERARSRVKVSSSKLRHIDDGAPDAFSSVLTQKEIDPYRNPRKEEKKRCQKECFKVKQNP